MNPFDYKVKDDECEAFKLACYHNTSAKNPKAILYFLPDFGLSANNYGAFFKPFGAEATVRTYSFDRRGYGRSQGKRNALRTDDRGFRDHWDFFDAVAFLRGYPKTVPKILVSHGLGSLFAMHLVAQRPGFFAGSILVSPWLAQKNPPSWIRKGSLQA
jgi:pimeloyl-ACP methyl ester carboxylesterase